MRFSQKEHDDFLSRMKEYMLTDTIVDSAIFDINNMFFDKAFCEGGDDLIAEYDSNQFVYQMTIRLTEDDVLLWDTDKDLELYTHKRDEVLDLIKTGVVKI